MHVYVAAGALFLALMVQAGAQDAKSDASLVDKYIQSTFGNASPEWRARLRPDETLAAIAAFIDRILFQNPHSFLSQSPKFRIGPDSGDAITAAADAPLTSAERAGAGVAAE